MNPVDVAVGSIVSLVIAVADAVFIPGLERKIQARLQQRIGPPVTTPGFWNMLKFRYKKTVKEHSPNPGVYHILLLMSLGSVAFILLFSTPFWWGILGFGSVLGILGLLKLEEVSYMMMGSFSRSVMSVGLPWADTVKYAAFRDAPRRFFEQIASVRALKMITLGSFPFYVALLVPFAAAGSMSIQDVVLPQNPVYAGNYGTGFLFTAECMPSTLASLNPFLLTIPGLLAAGVYFIGYNIVTNNRPFDIVKPKVDIIEGPMMEYAAVWRGLYYLLTGLLSFTLSSLFITLFLGIPFDVRFPGTALLHLILLTALPAAAAILKAFSPVFTFKQVYRVSFTATLIGVIALAAVIL